MKQKSLYTNDPQCLSWGSNHSRTAVLTALLILISFSSFSQGIPSFNPLESTPYVEVTGEGETEVIPDEIYLRFTLKERYDGRNKTGLDKMEKDMRQLIAKNGFSTENLSLADANSDYITIKRQKKDVLQSKDFVLKVSTTAELTRLWNILEEVNAENAYVSRVDHSQMEEVKKEVKIKAVKNAKEKADYLLGAVNEKTGKILFMQERENYMPVFMTKSQQRMEMADAESSPAPAEPEIAFQKLKLNYKVFVRFAIE